MIMKSRIAVIYYSSYGHTYEMAQATVDGARKAGAEVRLRRVAELPDAEKAMSTQDAYVEAQQEQADVEVATLDDLRWADGVVWGVPTRYGNMPAQLKQFIDTTGPLWQKGELEDKATGIFTSTATIHGGQESTILTSLVPLLHLGMVFVGTPYGQNPQIMTDEGIGGSPYGPGTIAGPDGSRTPVQEELETARRLGARVAEVAALLRPMREEKQERDETGRQKDGKSRSGRAA
jgi:NAD(P)H dehydrogenase (quinone)